MKDIFKHLYYGEISEWDKKIDKKLKNIAKENEAYETMIASFTEENGELFEKFYKELMETVSEEKAIVYENGVKLGIWLGLELANFDI